MIGNKIRFGFFMTLLYSLTALSFGQTSTTVVPPLVKFAGNVADASGKPMTGVIGVTFFLYKDAQGGAPVWLETQNVHADRLGNYSVMLGSATSQGLPSDLFVSGEARWLGVQISGQPEQPRVLLLSVPYALKAADAETVGGLPASAFMLAAPVASNGSHGTDAASAGTAASATPAATSNVTTSGGAVNTIPLFTTGTNIQNSLLTQTGTTAVNVAGKLNLPATGTATATASHTSRPEDFVASAFNSTSNAAVAQTFQLQAEPSGNNTAAPSGNLSLLFGSGTTAPTETGFKINNKGILTFAAGQTFPGTGKGTITGVTAGTGLTGGGTTGAVTLKLNTATIPQLGTANNFTAPQDFKANVGVGATPSGNGYTPLTVGGTTNFGTWMAISNTSAGGHTWNIISAGSGNAEGAGNLGITDLTGTSTIWLEGNTNTSNLSATGTASASTLNADALGKNAGGPTPGILFGFGSGEGIASNRVIGPTKYGLDFYTDFTSRMSILQSGRVGIGTSNPTAQLAVVAPTNGISAIYAQAADAAGGSGQNGSDGLDAYGSNGDPNSSSTAGGNGVTGYGGGGADQGGTGGIFIGASALFGGAGIYATGGGTTGDGIEGASGNFNGDVLVTGSVDTTNVVVKIDHPLDPANKYLSQSSLQSPDMMNFYNGNIVTDADGNAVVVMPDWVEAINGDFRYQLTVVGQFAQAIIADKISGNKFSIKTDKPNVEVSWQVTGVRQDAWANAHRTPVEQEKNTRERGHYLHPELYGASEESSIDWARHPEMMKRLKEHRLNVRQAAKLAVTTK
jgi:trimeric autotransporter adhesin